MAPVKLIISWDIVQDREQEYFEFVIREFIPGVQRLGFELSDAWATVYGSQPQSWSEPCCLPTTRPSAS